MAFNETDVYYPNSCYVCRCFGENVSLKRCGACGMISYCSKAHQIKDWANHKEFCKVLCQIMKEWKVDNLFQTLKDKNVTMNEMQKILSKRLKKMCMSSEKSETVIKFDMFRLRRKLQTTGFDLFDFLILRISELLMRPLKCLEFDMIDNPRVCAVCFECNPKLLKNCTKCPQSSFCEIHINDPSHENVCIKYLSIFYLQNKSYANIVESMSYINEDMKLPLQKNVEKLPNSMMQFFEKYFSNVPYNMLEIEKRFAFDSYFSEKYSIPLSILFAMEKLNLNLDSMLIHVVGAHIREQVFSYWETILHYLPQLRKLTLILIGPELFPFDANVQNVCKLCVEDKRQLIIKKYATEYHNYCSSKNFEKPDMIACFNPGFHAYSSWKKSIAVFNKGQCPLMVTNFNQTEGIQDKDFIDSKYSSAKCVFNDYNPFACLHYIRSNIRYKINAINEFMFIYEHFGYK